jgi:hypothetical protein
VSTKGNTIKQKGANCAPPLPVFRKWRGGFRPIKHLLALMKSAANQQFESGKRLNILKSKSKGA